MKKILILFLLSGIYYPIPAQSPHSFNYQGIARLENGNLLADSELVIEISILTGDPDGTESYQEIHSVHTNDFGLFNIKVGEGEPVNGELSQVNWGNNAHYIRTRLDLMDGLGFVDLGAAQLLSVPYALFANTSAETTEEDSDNQTLDLQGSVLSIANGNSVDLGSLEDQDNQQLNLQDNMLSITNGNSIDLSLLVEDDQTLTLEGNTLSIENGNSVTLPTSTDGGFLENFNNGVGYKGESFHLINNDDTDAIRLGKFEDGGGFIGNRGGNSNYNVTITTLNSHPEHGFIAVKDDAGTTKTGVYVDAESAGKVITDGINDERNVELTHFAGYPNHGMVTVHDENGNAWAGMFIDPDGFGVIYADAIETFVDHPTNKNLKYRYSYLQGPERATYLRGTATITYGTANISFPEYFANQIDAGSMTVMITPLSANSKGIAVIEKNQHGFQVKELLEGKGNYEFDWEVKAKRINFKDYKLLQSLPVPLTPGLKQNSEDTSSPEK